MKRYIWLFMLICMSIQAQDIQVPQWYEMVESLKKQVQDIGVDVDDQKDYFA